MAYPRKPSFGLEGGTVLVAIPDVVSAVPSIAGDESKRAMIAAGTYEMPNSATDALGPVKVQVTVFRETPVAAVAKAQRKLEKATDGLTWEQAQRLLAARFGRPASSAPEAHDETNEPTA